MKPEDDAYLSFSEASDNEYEYFVKRVRKPRPDPQSNEQRANKFEGPFKPISEQSDSEK